uniref:Uncharacterized protein n=1 Tax=Arundo donax TaxID=35708 RepID=A0A0A9HPR0_ARUDO
MSFMKNIPLQVLKLPIIQSKHLCNHLNKDTIVSTTLIQHKSLTDIH